MERFASTPSAEILEPGYVPLNPDDRSWLEEVGCQWPDLEHESAWLTKLNNIVEIASTSEKSLDNNRDSPSDRQKSLQAIRLARQTFFDVLPGTKKCQDHLNARGRRLLPADTVVEAMRTFHKRGGHLNHILNRAPMILALRPAEIDERIDNLNSLGFNGVDLINNHAGFFAMAPESIQERYQALRSAGKALGLSRDRVNEIISTYPVLLSYRSDKTRTVARVVAQTVKIAPADGELNKFVLSLYIHPLESTVVAYLNHGDVIRSASGLGHHARRYRTWPQKVLEHIIGQHPDDPVVKAYLKNYPINDPEAAQYAYERHLRARDRRKTEVNLTWEGPTLMGDPTTPVFKSYREVIESPPLTDTESNALDMAIQLSVLTEEQIKDTIDELDPDKEALVARGDQARRVLVARHLQLAVEAATRHGRDDDERAEMAGTANLALATAVQEYVPGGVDFMTLAKDAIDRALGIVQNKRGTGKGYPTS